MDSKTIRNDIIQASLMRNETIDNATKVDSGDFIIITTETPSYKVIPYEHNWQVSFYRDFNVKDVEQISNMQSGDALNFPPGIIIVRF